MRERQNRGDALPRQPPKWLPQANHVKNQRQCLQRHDDERCHRDRHHIGQGTVEPCLVKMKQGDGGKDKFNGDAGQDERSDRPRRLSRQALVAPFGQPPYERQIMHDNNGRNGRKAELKTRARHGLGPEYQHY